MTFNPPDYSNHAMISDVMPAAALAAGAGSALAGFQTDRAVRLGVDAEARVVVVALIDGLGLELLTSSFGYAPFLRAHREATGELSAGFPSTTANSLSSLGTGLLPGAHGVMGYRLLDPDTDTVFNQLTWDSARDPGTWVEDETLLERIAHTGVDVVSLGEPKFVGRGLNAASLRGGRFRGSNGLSARVKHAIQEITAPGRRLIYFYWGGLDKIGHQKGTDSGEWEAELEAVDKALSDLANALPKDALLLITADHGMVDIDHSARTDLADHPEIEALLRGVGGEPRALHLYAHPGAQAEAHSALSELMGAFAQVMTREQAVRAGWFGPVRQRNLARIGDLVVVCGPGAAIVNSRTDSPAALSLRGHHGGVTRAELAIPLLPVAGS